MISSAFLIFGKVLLIVNFTVTYTILVKIFFIEF